jgi:hypothetical protein
MIPSYLSLSSIGSIILQDCIWSQGCLYLGWGRLLVHKCAEISWVARHLIILQVAVEQNVTFPFRGIPALEVLYLHREDTLRGYLPNERIKHELGRRAIQRCHYASFILVANLHLECLLSPFSPRGHRRLAVMSSSVALLPKQSSLDICVLMIALGSAARAK